MRGERGAVMVGFCGAKNMPRNSTLFLSFVPDAGMKTTDENAKDSTEADPCGMTTKGRTKERTKAKSASSFFCFAGVFVDPVHLPGLSSVFGEGLFGLGGVGGDLPHGKPYEHGSAVDEFVVVEVGASVLELACAGNADCADVRGGEVDIPFAGIGIEPAQGQQLNVACRAVR